MGNITLRKVVFLAVNIFAVYAYNDFFISQQNIFFRLLEVIENEPTTTAASINEIRQKFSTNSQPMNGEQSVTKMEVDDTNSMKVNTPSRQSSAAALIS